HQLAVAHQAQLLARDRFDRGRILTETADIVAESLVVAALAREIRGKVRVLTPGSDRLQQAPAAKQRVDYQHERDEPQDGVHGPRWPGRRRRHWPGSTAEWLGSGRGHGEYNVSAAAGGVFSFRVREPEGRRPSVRNVHFRTSTCP